jgi:hypothetical protein
MERPINERQLWCFTMIEDVLRVRDTHTMSNPSPIPNRFPPLLSPARNGEKGWREITQSKP